MIPFQLTHKLSVLRSSLKSTAISSVKTGFKALTHDRRKQLLEDNEYWYKLSDVGFYFLWQCLRLTHFVTF